MKLETFPLQKFLHETLQRSLITITMSYEEVASRGRKRSLSGEGSHYYQVLGIEKGKTQFQFRISSFFLVCS